MHMTMLIISIIDQVTNLIVIKIAIKTSEFLKLAFTGFGYELVLM